MLYLVLRRNKYHLVSSPTGIYSWHVGGDYTSTGAIARRAGIFQMSDDEEIVVSLFKCTDIIKSICPYKRQHCTVVVISPIQEYTFI